MHVREFAYVPACEHICHRMHDLRVYMHVRVSVWLRACECVRMCKRMCLSVRAYACTCVFMSAFVDVCAIKCVRAGVRIYTCVCTCPCVRVHVHNMCQCMLR